MIDDTFRTDREVGEFIEGARQPGARPRPGRGRGRSRSGGASLQSSQALLSAIGDIEAQLQSLAGSNASAGSVRHQSPVDPHYSDLSASRDNYSGRRARRGRVRNYVDQSRRSEPSAAVERDYQDALARIESQISRVNQALSQQSRSTPTARTSRLANSVKTDKERRDASLNRAIQQIVDRAHSLDDGYGSEDHLRGAGAVNPGLSGYGAIEDDSVSLLREDIANLRELLEEANFSGANEQTLSEITALSGRIDNLAKSMSQNRTDPGLRDALVDIHALLDKPAQDPSIDQHFDRILDKLDHLPIQSHEADFERLSGQIDSVRDMLTSNPQAKQFSSLEDQISVLAQRLGSLEANIAGHFEDGPSGAAVAGLMNAGREDSQNLQARLSSMQDLLEQLDPSDRLMRLEDQLAALADRLEHGSDDMRSPLESLSGQLETLTQMVNQQSQNNQHKALATLADRVAELDQRLSAGPVPDSRFDQVEQTLARIDTMVSRKMETSDLSHLEASLSRIADRMETGGHTSEAGVAPQAMAQLERQIAALADRLDAASQNPSDSGSFEALTERLDALADQFTHSQNRFEAVDRLGTEVQRLAKISSQAVYAPHSEKVAEAAAVRALQQIGPLAGNGGDSTLDALVDGLKDDLAGLRQLAENNESSTQTGLNNVTDVLYSIVDRLGALEDQVRTGEDQVRTGENVAAQNLHMQPQRLSSTPEMAPSDNGAAVLRATRADDAGEQDEGIGKRSLASMLRRRKDGGNNSDGGETQVHTDMPQAQAADQAAAQSQPGVRMTGKGGSSRNSGQAAKPQQQGRLDLDPSQAIDGNTALKPRPATAQIVDGGQGPRTGGKAIAGSSSKADFIAAARRAAQAAAQESAQVAEESGKSPSLMDRLKAGRKTSQKEEKAQARSAMALGGKKRKDPALDAAGMAPTVSAGDDGQNGMNRKQRRAAVAEAARKAKQIKDLEASSAGEMGPDADLDLMDLDVNKASMLSKLGEKFTHYRRPLLMAAAAILLAITTLQLAKNPKSSLYSLFNSPTEQSETIAPAASEQQGEQSNAVEPSSEVGSDAVGPQSSLTPSSGSLGPRLPEREANNAIAFSAPSASATQMQSTQLPGPRLPNAQSDPLVANEVSPAASLPQSQAGGDVGVDLTPTSSIPSQAGQALTSDGAALQQAMPVKPGDASSAVNSAVQAAAQMNTMLAPGIKSSALQQAANSGDALAQFEMGQRLTLGKGLPVDMKAAAGWFEKAAEQSMPQAQYSLANLYEKGHGVKKDLQVARLWYERSARAGNIKAMHNLAVMHAEGGLGKPDFKTASTWFIKAADHGLKDSQYNLAILYARGMGVKQDLIQSYKWFDVAARSGDRGAASKRDEVLRVLTSSQQKTAKAIVKAWVPKPAKPSANQVATLPEAWQNKAPGQMVKAPEKSRKVASMPNAPKQVVHKVQGMLGALGYNAGRPDGQMGPRTRTAIRNFEQAVGLPVTGKISKELLEALSMRVI